jgi:hypothetical protein
MLFEIVKTDSSPGVTRGENIGVFIMVLTGLKGPGEVRESSRKDQKQKLTQSKGVR